MLNCVWAVGEQAQGMRLGFPVRVLGQRGLRAYDTRRLRSSPHLSVSLAHLRDIFAYLSSAAISFYRLAADLAPYGTRPGYPQFHLQLEECAAELADLAAQAWRSGLRLTVHAGSHVQLGAEDAAVGARSVEELIHLAELLEALGPEPDLVVVTHIGGAGRNAGSPVHRWTTRFERLPEAARRRIVLEHDEDAGASLGACLQVHGSTGVPLVFDYLHFRINNPERWSLEQAIAVALATWPSGRTPKLHFSSPRTELVATPAGAGSKRRWALRPPRPGHHADFANPWEFRTFVDAIGTTRDADIMLELKAGDLALLRLRDDLRRFAPEVAAKLR